MDTMRRLVVRFAIGVLVVLICCQHSLRAGLISVTFTSINNKAFDLSINDPSDWAHWGLNAPTSLDHKLSASGSGAVGLISDETAVFPTGRPAITSRYDLSRIKFSWEDGTPNRSVTNTQTELRYKANDGLNANGF